MICNNCGRECSGSLRYCRLCGADLMAQNTATKEFPPFSEKTDSPAPAKEKGSVRMDMVILLFIAVRMLKKPFRNQKEKKYLE